MSNNILFSIIINCKNGSNFLHKCLSSVQKQTYKNWEVIFFDNFSTDNSKEILHSFNEKKFKYYLNKEPTNLSIARNRAIQLASGEYIAILDHDDWWIEKKLEIINNILKNKKYDFLFSDFFQYNQINDKKKLIKSNIKKDLFSSILKNYNLGLNTFVLKKKLFNNTSFDDNFHIIGDFVLIYNLAKNISWFHINVPLCFYRLHTLNESLINHNLHIKELKTFYISYLKSEKINKDIKLSFIEKLKYMKYLKYFKEKNIKEMYTNLKNTKNFSIYKLKKIYYLIKLKFN